MKMKEQHMTCGEKDSDMLYKIGMFAAMNHVTVKTLRFYEEQGLLIPAAIDSDNGYRYYKLSQMAVIHQINALKQAGFTLEEIGCINAGADEEALLLKKKSEILAKIADLTKQVAALDGYLAKKSAGLKAPVLVKTIPQIQAACIFHKGSYHRFPESYKTVLQYIEDNGYEIAGTIRESYIDGVWNKENENDWLSEIQVPVRKRVQEGR